eukprot:TRINITY_DN5799_c0_g2_i2.p2 TRINITY_DN5799_c0_g2~~TRINITY_DN5799_c0_g2_i2.p2  ORF type:complete len:140 (-),score=12.03 TRINITY_DN5799_c0_g2_i2:111-530(-)
MMRMTMTNEPSPLSYQANFRSYFLFALTFFSILLSSRFYFLLDSTFFSILLSSRFYFLGSSFSILLPASAFFSILLLASAFFSILFLDSTFFLSVSSARFCLLFFSLHRAFIIKLSEGYGCFFLIPNSLNLTFTNHFYS